MKRSDFSTAMVQTMREPMLLLDAELRVQVANRSFQEMFQVTAEQTHGKPVYELGNGEWNSPALRKLLLNILSGDKPFDDLEVKHDFPSIGRRTMLLNARKVQFDGEPTQLILLVMDEVTPYELNRREKEDRYHVLFELGPVAIYACDSSGVIQEFNRRAVELWGREPKLGDNNGRFCGSLKMIGPDGRVIPHEQCPMVDVLSGKIPGAYDMPVVIERPDGTRIDVVVNIRAMKNVAGEITGAINCFYDVTERKRSQEILRESEERLRLALDAANMGTWRADLITGLATRDANLNRILGLEAVSSTHAIDDHFRLIDPADRPAALAAWERALKEKSLYEVEYRIRREDGSFCWLAEKGKVLTDTKGRPVSVAGVTLDITARKLAGRKLQESEVRYRRLFEAAHDGILILEVASGKVLEVNRFMLDMLHQQSEYFLGKELWELGVFHDKQECQQAMEWLKKEGSIRYENLPLQDREGRPIPVEFVSNIYMEDLKPVIQCNIRDISERRHFEEEREAHLTKEQQLRVEAETANRAKDMFLATLSHELRTPLSAIVGWVAILNRSDRTENELREGLEVIGRNTTAQVQLIEDVLDVSRIVSGKMRLEIRPCELDDIINAGLDMVRPAAEARGITIKSHMDPTASRLSCDAARIQQVVWNLLSNAIKFTPKGGTVSIRLSREQSCFQIEVTDSGQGIEAELLPFVFDRFRQADSSTRRRFGGLGLGLSIVKHIVEMHGGTVEAHSNGEGKGSTFAVSLPIRAVKTDDGPEKIAGDSEKDLAAFLPLVRLDGLRVLVVDDEADARRLLIKTLSEAGAVVTAACSTNEALEAISVEVPEVLVSDLGMPDQDGYDLIRRIRGRGIKPKDLPAVALTAFVAKEDQRRALLAGFQVHVPKPVDPRDLLAVVASISGRTG